MNHFVYIIRCADNTLYTGYATDLEKRMIEHNGEDAPKSRGAKYTRGRRPVKLVHQEKFSSRSEAMKRECEIKSLSRPEKLALIKTNGQKKYF
jgi:putative endonuclease